MVLIKSVPLKQWHVQKGPVLPLCTQCHQRGVLSCTPEAHVLISCLPSCTLLKPIFVRSHIAGCSVRPEFSLLSSLFLCTCLFPVVTFLSISEFLGRFFLFVFLTTLQERFCHIKFSTSVSGLVSAKLGENVNTAISLLRRRFLSFFFSFFFLAINVDDARHSCDSTKQLSDFTL